MIIADSVELFKPKRDLESESARQRFRICGCFLDLFGSGGPHMPIFLFDAVSQLVAENCKKKELRCARRTP